MHTQVSHCSCLSSVHQKFPGQLDAASALAFCPVALIYHSTLSHLQVSSFARLSVHKPNGCRSRSATFTFQCNVPATLPFSSDPVGRPFQNISFAFFCAFLPRPLAIPSRPQTQFQSTRPQQRFREATFAMGSAPKFSPCPQPHGPHLSLGGSGICSNICST